MKKYIGVDDIRERFGDGLLTVELFRLIIKSYKIDHSKIITVRTKANIHFGVSSRNTKKKVYLLSLFEKAFLDFKENGRLSTRYTYASNIKDLTTLIGEMKEIKNDND